MLHHRCTTAAFRRKYWTKTDQICKTRIQSLPTTHGSNFQGRIKFYQCYKRNTIVRTTVWSDRISWKQNSTPGPSLPTWAGSIWVTARYRACQKSTKHIYRYSWIWAEGCKTQCNLLRKRWSLIWSRIKDITSSSIYSRIWHYTAAISL